MHFDRGRMYWGYIQFLLILMVFFESYKDTKFGVWFYSYSYITIPAFVILFVLVATLIGYLDKRYIRTAEKKEGSRYNPYMTEIHKMVKELYKKEKDG